MYTVPPAQHDSDPDFWDIYQITMKRSGWIFIGVHLLLIWLYSFLGSSKSGGGFMPEGIITVFFIIYSSVIIAFDNILIRFSLFIIEKSFQWFSIEINMISYVIFSSVIAISLIIPTTMLSMNLGDETLKVVGIYIPLIVYFLFIVVFPILKFKIPRKFH